MASYKILISRRALKDLKNLSPDLVREISKHIDALTENPRPVGCKKLKGVEEEYRIKVKRDYRVLYTINDEEKVVDVSRIRHRKEAYR